MIANWYWYVARDNELLLDIDNFTDKIRLHASMRLQGAIEYGYLSVKSLIVYPSSSIKHGNRHVHIHIVLEHDMEEIQRYVWEVMLRSDIYRACSNIMRSRNGIYSPDLLISRQRWINRLPDAVCTCEGKHTAAVMQSCQAAIKLRGEQRTQGFFGKPSKNRCPWL